MSYDFVGLEYKGATDTAAMTSGKALFLLEWKGGGSEFIYNDGSTDPTNGAWTTDIGTPTAPKVQIGVGWERLASAQTFAATPSGKAFQATPACCFLAKHGGYSIDVPEQTTLRPAQSIVPSAVGS